LSEAPSQLVLCKSHHQVMLDHLLTCLPEEGCGLVGGQFGPDGARAQAILPVTNELHSPVRFYMAPLEQLKALSWLDENELELVAIFHSHPAGPPGPSPTDLAEFAYPGVLYLIFSPAGGSGPAVPASWQASAYWITESDRSVARVALVRVPGC
jgi:proteasome lid subunit RPN8/RPN11